MANKNYERMLVPAQPPQIQDSAAEEAVLEQQVEQEEAKPSILDRMRGAAPEIKSEAAYAFEQAKSEVSPDDLSDLLDVTHSDITGDKDDEDNADLTDVDEEDVMGEGDEDMSDLFEVTNEDIMGSPPMTRNERRAKRFKAKAARRQQEMGGGMQGMSL